MAAATNGTLSSTHANGTSNGGTPPKIQLYTNHRCPWAHRAHIVLEELKLPYEETIIDLDTPRPQWYLDINPRGLVPSIKYSVPGITDKEEIIYESAVVSQFLCDAFPSHLLPSSHEDPTAPLRRARINFFVDAWFTKIASLQRPIMFAEASEKEAKVDEFVAAVAKEIEPLLEGAAPFFGGSKELTLAEALTAPFLLRFYTFADDTYVPASLATKLDKLPNFGKWSKAVREHPSTTTIYDGPAFVEGFAKKYGKDFKTM